MKHIIIKHMIRLKMYHQKFKNIYGDPYIKKRKGIFEYILGGSKDAKLLDVRVFDEATKKSVYSKQIKELRKKVYQIVHFVQ